MFAVKIAAAVLAVGAAGTTVIAIGCVAAIGVAAARDNKEQT